MEATAIETRVDQVVESDLESIAQRFRSLQGATFGNWMECSQVLHQARQHFEISKDIGGYYKWAKEELGLTRHMADRLPLIHSEFGHYSRDLYPYIDVNVLLHLVQRRYVKGTKSRITRLRRLYTRRINANGGTRVSYETFRFEIFKDRGGQLNSKAKRWTLDVNGLNVSITDPTGTLSNATIKRRLRAAISKKGSLQPK